MTVPLGLSHPYCLCKHPKESHHTTVVNGRVVPFCRECEECNGFGVIEPPRPTHAELVASLDAPTELGAEGPRTNEEGRSVGAADRPLIYAWDALLCSSCEWRTSAPDLMARADPLCLQCGSAMTAVRIEMYEREG